MDRRPRTGAATGRTASPACLCRGAEQRRGGIVTASESVAGTAVAGRSGHGVFQVRVEAGGYDVLTDEPVADGGLATGPNPFDLLRASLASCTLMTLQAYASLKGWTFDDLRVRVTHHKGEHGARDRFDRTILVGNATEEQRER